MLNEDFKSYSDSILAQDWLRGQARAQPSLSHDGACWEEADLTFLHILSKNHL